MTVGLDRSSPRASEPSLWSRGPWGMVLVLLFALGLGATAGLLQGFQLIAPPSPSHAFPTLGPLGWLLLALVVGLAFCAFLYRLLRRPRGDGLPVNTLLLVGMFALTMVIVVGAVTIGYLAEHQHAPIFESGGGAPGANSTPPGTTPPTGGTNSSNTTGVPGKSVVSRPPAITPTLVGVVVGVLLAICLVPTVGYLWARRRHMGHEFEVEGAVGKVSEHLEAALRALEGAGTGDARAQIIRAYAALLSSLEDERVGDLGPATPREIEEICRRRLKLSSPGAQSLRELFEEARYSEHVLGPARGGEARTHLQQVLTELRGTHGPEGSAAVHSRGGFP